MLVFSPAYSMAKDQNISEHKFSHMGSAPSG